jgi:L-threonylcarbamoyladenylate synthase
MKVITITEETGPRDSQWKEIVSVMKKGGVVAHASDTCYGLTADAFKSAAVKKILKIKQSDEEKPMSIFVSEVSQIHEFAQVNSKAENFIMQNLPGPFTVILPKQHSFKYQKFNPTIGIRIPDNTFMRRLVHLVHGPCVTTSANLSGNPPIYDGNLVLKEFTDQKHQPDLIVDFGKIPGNKPSKIVSFTNGEMRWLR